MPIGALVFAAAFSGGLMWLAHVFYRPIRPRDFVALGLDAEDDDDNVIEFQFVPRKRAGYSPGGEPVGMPPAVERTLPGARP